MKKKCMTAGIKSPGRACAHVIVGDKTCGFSGECENKDPYNGDDGPGFDEEFHYKLTCGLHLMSEDAQRYFEIGFKAAKVFMEQKQK